MSNNRHLVNDLDIVRPPQLLDKGLLGLGKYAVDDGWQAVITEGGAFKEILSPGTYALSRYSLWRDVKAILVDTRIQTLTVSTAGEFTIAQPAPAKINLDLGVEYRVVDPRRVATEIKTPLTGLFDRVIQAVSGVIVHVTYDEFRTQGQDIARLTLERLQAMNLPQILGIAVLNVIVTSITGADPIAQQYIKEYITGREVAGDIAMSQLPEQVLKLRYPDLWKAEYDGRREILLELIRAHEIDPAAFLNRPPGAAPLDIASILGSFGIGAAQSPVSSGAQGTTLIPSTAGSLRSEPDLRARIKEDLAYLRGEQGAWVDARAGQDESGLPDGTYSFEVKLGVAEAPSYTLYLFCPIGYPKVAPTLDLEHNGNAVAFQSAVLRRWSGQYLVEIVREIRNYYGL